MKKTTFILFGLLAAILFVLIYNHSVNNSFTSKASTQSENNSLVENRNFVEIDFKEVSNFEQIENHLLTPQSVLQSNNNRYVLPDFADMKIKMVDQQGNLIREYGNGRGRGPGEFSIILDFTICESTLWAVDGTNLRITGFDIENGTETLTFNTEYHPARIACVSDGLIIMQMGGEHSFNKHDFDGNLIKEFGQLTENQHQKPLSLDGQLKSFEDGFLYLPKYASYVYHFDSEGNQLQIIKLPDGLDFPDPNVSTTSERRMTTAPQTLVTNQDLFFDADKSYMIVNSFYWGEERGGRGEGFAVFDKFDISTGNYIESIEVPFYLNRIIFEDNLLIGFRSSTSGVYSYKVEESSLF